MAQDSMFSAMKKEKNREKEKQNNKVISLAI